MNFHGAPGRRAPKSPRNPPPHLGRRGDPPPPGALQEGVPNHDEGAGGPADLDARAPQRRDQEAGDDRREHAALGTDAARDRERDRERQRDDANDYTRDRVREELLAGVILERSDELGNEAVQIPCPVTSRGESSRGA